jgi:hypothetical protein
VLFDGLVFLHRALGSALRLVAIRTRPANRPAWALLGADGRPRVLVENLSIRHAIVARIRLPQARGWAQVHRLTRAGGGANGRWRMAIDGRTLADRNGRLVAVGPAHRGGAAIRGGVVRVALTPLSAALVIAPRPVSSRLHPR